MDFVCFVGSGIAGIFLFCCCVLMAFLYGKMENF